MSVGVPSEGTTWRPRTPPTTPCKKLGGSHQSTCTYRLSGSFFSEKKVGTFLLTNEFFIYYIHIHEHTCISICIVLKTYNMPTCLFNNLKQCCVGVMMGVWRSCNCPCSILFLINVALYLELERARRVAWNKTIGPQLGFDLFQGKENEIGICSITIKWNLQARVQLV